MAGEYTPESVSILPISVFESERQEDLTDAQFLLKRSMSRDSEHALAIFAHARVLAPHDLRARSQILVHNFLIEETALRQQSINELELVFALPSAAEED